MAVRPIRISVVADADKARKELSGLGESMKTGLKVAAAGGAAGLVVLAKAAVNAASEAQQSIGATQAIYGKYADSVINRSKEAADAVGLSANAYRESANLLGALFKNQGVELKRLSSTTDEHLKLASDLSAMYGGTVPEAVEALTAAYKGEFNQLEKYGVTLKQDTINTKANEVAKRKYGKELKNLTPAQEGVAKQLATQKLLFKQTKDAAGSFGRESNTLAGQQQRLQAELDNVKAEVGTALLPVLTDLAQWARRDLVPALEDFAKWLGRNEDEIQSVAREVGNGLLPVLKTTGEVVGDVVGFFVDLPGPVKEIGVQVGIAALVFPRLAGGVSLATGAVTTHIARLQQLRAELTYTATRAQATSAALARMGAAAKAAAGIGGFVLLAQGMQQTDVKAKALLTTAGGIATGFAVAGPVGAAIGGMAGLLIGLKDHFTNAQQKMKLLNEEALRLEGMKAYQKALEGVRDTLDQVTGASTQTTRQWALERLQKEQVLKSYEALGISQRTAVSAVLGNKKAIAELTTALGGADPVIATLNAEFREQQTATREAADATESLRDRLGLTGAELKRIPKNVRIAIQDDVPDSLAEIRRLNTQVNGLDKRTIKILLKAADLPATQANIKKVKKELESLGNTKPSPNLRNKFTADIGAIRAAVKPQIVTLNTILSKAGDVKPKIANGPFGRGVSADLTAISGTARTKATVIGLNIGSGMYNGVSAWAGPIAAKARQIVADAVAAANAAGDIHSPSRKTRYTGEMLGAGLADGLRRTTPKAKTAGQKLIQSVLAGVKAGSSGVGSALDKVTASVRKAITGKNQGKREAAYLKSLRDEYAALKRNGAAQDRVAAKLEKARDRLKELTDQYNDYRKAIVDSITTTGDVTQLGRNEDGTVSITGLISELKNKVVAAQRFAVLIRDLAGKGLSRTAIQQMLDAGPEAALATAEAISFGGASAIKEINDLQAELAKTGSQLGDSMADRYYGAGVRAAEGLVKGLEAQAKNLDKAAVRLANALVKAVKRALGIKSPSRVFTGIGDNVTKGLVIGLDDTYVKRSGAVMAASLQKGFGTPALDAYASDRGADESRTITIRFTADQLDRLSRGKAIQADLDYARSNGVRGVTF